MANKLHYKIQIDSPEILGFDRVSSFCIFLLVSTFCPMISPYLLLGGDEVRFVFCVFIFAFLLLYAFKVDKNSTIGEIDINSKEVKFRIGEDEYLLEHSNIHDLVFDKLYEKMRYRDCFQINARRQINIFKIKKTIEKEMRVTLRTQKFEKTT